MLMMCMIKQVRNVLYLYQTDVTVTGKHHSSIIIHVYFGYFGK